MYGVGHACMVVLHTYSDVESARHGIKAIIDARRKVAAVIFGGAFDANAVQRIRESGEAEKNHTIRWLIPDRQIRIRNNPFQADKMPAYGHEIGQRVLRTLDRLETEGLLLSNERSDHNIILY